MNSVYLFNLFYAKDDLRRILLESESVSLLCHIYSWRTVAYDWYNNWFINVDLQILYSLGWNRPSNIIWHERRPDRTCCASAVEYVEN